MGLYSVHATRGSNDKRLRADMYFVIQASFYTKKFNNVIKSDPYTNMTLLLYCCQKECTQLLIKGTYPNNHDENNNTAQQFWKREVALNMFYPYLNGPHHTYCSQQICWVFTHWVRGTQVVFFVWYVPVHAAVTGMHFLVNCSMVLTHPSYSPNQAPAEIFLSPNWKIPSKNKDFRTSKTSRRM